MDWKVVVFACLISFTVCSATVASPTDFLFLLDSSDSTRSNNFEIEERFAVQLIQALYSNDNRFGLFTFGSQTHEQFYLNAYDDEQQIVQAVKYMWYSTGNGDVEKAINFTLANGFRDFRGDRECVPNIFIILTHSPIKSQAVAHEFRDALSSKGAHTFVLNMAGGAAEANFTAMTDSPSRVINVRDFTALDNLVSSLQTTISADMPGTGCGTVTQWQAWTKCSASCGKGLKFRVRTCQKDRDTDKDCAAELSEDATCSMPDCTEPVDGRWANWNAWSKCTKTCGTGSQLRTRECAAPIPRLGGKPCPGSNQAQRDCAEFDCPDCQASCPPGGHLSTDCQTCECSSATLFGQITDETGLPVANAEIYISSRRYKAIARTGEMGHFSVSGVCLMNEQIFVSASLHESKLYDPTLVNTTHMELNSKLLKYIPATFTVHPHDKSRMVGQSFSLCCSALGKPSPAKYIWLKDGVELENEGTSGTLAITSALKNHTGTYKCSTETLAGVSQSDEAHITVSDFTADTCGAPVSKLEQLPPGCFLAGDATKSSSVDIGTCGRAKCMTSSLKDNGTCTDWWPHYCCDTKDIQQLDIRCNGFSYKTARVQSCQCKLCTLRTVISGRAFGRNNSKDVPLKLGSIFVSGKKIGQTNMVGSFKFNVPVGTKRVVATFHDTMFKQLMDITKIITAVEGEEVYATVNIPLKPKPISVNTSHATDIDLGGGDDGMAPAASLSIQKDSFVSANGQVYRGAARATLHFMDPRDRDSLDTANGEFESESTDGEKAPLKTFGMFQLGVDDEQGNPLQIHKPMKFYLDSSLFNISLDSNGDPDVAMWDYDANKGVWVENSKLRFVTAQSGRRKLLQSSPQLVANIKPSYVPDMSAYETQTYHTERKWTGRYTNCDHSVKLYDNIRVADTPVLKQGICYVSVSVYTDMTLNEPLSTADRAVTITAYTQQMTGAKPYLGKTDTRKLVNGRACLMVYCDQHVYIKVESGGERLRAAKHMLPSYYPVVSTIKNEVKFESRDMGPAYDCGDSSCNCKSPPCSGPMYPFTKGTTCTNGATNDNSFHFNFAFFTKPSQHSYATQSPDVYDKPLSWYPVSPDKLTFRACYIKVLLRIHKTYDMRIMATSYPNSFGGDAYGHHTVGPTPKPNSNDDTVRGACLEYRCPGLVLNGSQEIFNVDTAVDIKLLTSNSSLKCKLSVRHTGLVPSVNQTTGQTGLQFFSKSGDNYGSSYGVFINDAHTKDVEGFCGAGKDQGMSIDPTMNPTKNYAVEFDCLN